MESGNAGGAVVSGGLQDVTIDFETYYSTERGYSLKAIPQTAYLRDPRFEVLMVGIAIGDMEPEVHIGEAAVRSALDAIPWERTRCISHNAPFDMAILWEKFGHSPRVITDTLAQSRLCFPRVTRHGLAAMAQFLGIGEKGQDLELQDGLDGERLARMPEMLRRRLAGYCAGDVKLARAIDRTLPPIQAFEISGIDEGTRMTSEPILRLDVPMLEGYRDKQAVQAQRHVRFRSKEVFAQALRAAGVEPETKKGKNGPIYAFAKTDVFMLRLKGHPKAEIRDLVEARLEAQGNDEASRVETLIAIGRTAEATLPAAIVPCKAHTGRDAGSGKINLQNLKRESPIRHAIRAPEGHTLIVADLAQIEARVLAVMAGQHELVEAFREGRDVYAEFASRVFGFTLTKASHPKERNAGKVAVLACGYGMGAARFAEKARSDGVEMDDAQAQKMVIGYRTVNAQIERFWGFCSNLLRIMNRRGGDEKPQLCTAPGIIFPVSRHRIHLPSGRALWYPSLRNETRRSPEAFKWTFAHASGGREKVYGGLVTENITQAVARDILFDQAHRIRKRIRGTGARLVLRIHDEGVWCCPDAAVGDVKGVIGEEMRRCNPDWLDVPLDVEIGTGQTWEKPK